MGGEGTLCTTTRGEQSHLIKKPTHPGTSTTAPQPSSKGAFCLVSYDVTLKPLGVL